MTAPAAARDQDGVRLPLDHTAVPQHLAVCAGAFPVVYPQPTHAGLVEGSGFGRLATRSTPEALATAARRAVADGAPQGIPAPAGRAAHAWPRVAASFLARPGGLLG